MIGSLSAINLARQHNRRRGLDDASDLADFIEQFVELLCRAGAQPDDVGELAADGTQLFDFGDALEALEDVACGFGFDDDADVGEQAAI